MNDDEKMEISLKAGALLSEYSTDIVLNESLWHRVKCVYDNIDRDTLTAEEITLLDNTYEMFERNGALLSGENRDRYKAIRAELSELTTKFAQNVVKELPEYEMWLEQSDLSGLPESAIEGAAYAAKQKGREGAYIGSAGIYVVYAL